MKARVFTAVLVLSMAGLLVLGLLSLAFGARQVPAEELINVLLGNMADTLDQAVVRERIPRTVFGMLAGMALGAAGALMQAVTRNPVADPGILGVNTGAALAVVIGISFFSIGNAAEFIWFALAGAGLTTVFVYSIGSLGSGGATPIKLALAGAATSAALSSLISAVILPRAEVLDVYRFWQVGGLSGASWEGILTVLPFLGAGLVLSFLVTPALEIMALGDDLAAGLGVRPGLIRLAGSSAAILLCGATTALAGPIGFVGLMVPHIVRHFTGANIRQLMLLSGLGGAGLLLLSDTLGRVVARPGELEAGIITALLGAPVLIIIARKGKFQLV